MKRSRETYCDVCIMLYKWVRNLPPLDSKVEETEINESKLIKEIIASDDVQLGGNCFVG